MKPRMTDVVLPPTFEQTAGFTPGPWSLRHSRDGSGDIGITANGVSNIIAECFVAMRSRDERADQEAEANARLIAAAPELLAALTACQRALTVIVDPKAIRSSSAAHAYVQAVEAKSKASAAIAKAKGGAQ